MYTKKAFKFSHRLILQVILFLTCFSLNAQINSSIVSGNNPKVFKAGAATSNITPMLGGGIVGNFGTPPAAMHVHDELHARCIALDDGTTKLVFVVADIIYMSRELIDEIKEIIHNETGLPVENILISGTHTHSSVRENQEGYKPFLVRRIADVVRIAINNLEPAQIGWGAGYVPQHVFVRRWKMKPGTPMPNPFGGQDQVVMNPGRANSNLLEPAGKPDTEVSFISIQSLAGRPIALLANYSLHYVGGVPDNHLSADYFGVFADRMQELLNADRQNPPFVAIMSNGTSGDVNNINFREPAEKNPPYAKMRIVADYLAREVLRFYKTVQHQEWVSLQAAQKELTLKSRKPDQQMIDRAKMVLARPDTVTPYHRHEKTYAQRTLQMLERPDQVDIIIQTFKIGDLGIAAIPFETFSETGLEIKARSPFKASFTIELANGSYGYLPTPSQHKLGGYETWLGTNRVETEASVKITDTILQLFSQMKSSGAIVHLRE